MTERPMPEADFFVLLALLDEPLHGYGIQQRAEALSDGRVRLRVGSLYGLLDRLTGAGLAERDRDEVHRGRLRRYYRVTDEGVAAVRRESEYAAAKVRTARERLAARPASGPGLPAGGTA